MISSTAEKPVKFVPTLKEAKGSGGVGAIIMGTVCVIITAIIVSDIPQMLMTLRGIKTPH